MILERILFSLTLCIIAAGIFSPVVFLPQFISAIRRKDKKQFLKLLLIPILLFLVGIPAYLILKQRIPI